ncbi:MAG TPA: WYL domain-containing protein, partial [Myxococcota bacterium]|nr:WYL domain-containing protein [Myxococcota bacterium]
MAGRDHFELLQELYDLVARGEATTAAALGRRLDRSVPQVYRYARTLARDHGAPLHYDRAARRWQAADAAWRLPRIRVSAAEVYALAVARSLLEAVAPSAPRRALDRLLREVRDAADDRLGPHAAGRVSAAEGTRVTMDDAVLERILDALRRGRAIRFRYRSPWTAESSVRDVDPFHLRADDHSLYLVGHSRERDAVRVFHLPFISDVVLLPDAARPAPADL